MAPEPRQESAASNTGNTMQLAGQALLFTLAAILFALGIAWWLEWLTIPFPRMVRDALVFTLFFVGGNFAARWLHRPAQEVATVLLHAVPALFLGWLWVLAGCLQNPAFLLFFALLPLASSISQRPMATWSSTLTAILAVWIAAIHQTPLLQWHLIQIGWPAPIAHLARTLPLPAPEPIYSSPLISPAFHVTVLLIFSFAQAALGLGAAMLTDYIHRLHQRLGTFNALTVEAKGLFQALLKAATEPTVVVYADTFQVVHASDSFIKRMMLRPEDLPGKTLFDLVAFEDSAAVRAAFSERSGSLAFRRLRIGFETLVANVNFFRTTHQGYDYLNIHFQEITDLYYFRAAFDSVDDALLIVEEDLRLLYANRAARALFGELYLGKRMDETLAPHQILPGQLTETSITNIRQARIGKTPYILSVSETQPTEGRRCYILWFRSLAREEALAEQALRDPLTGIYNRRAFETHLTALIAAGARDMPLTLALWDLDKLKEVNDNLGHGAGDEYIKGFARIVSSTLRSGELFARIGGDEFAIAFPGLTLARSRALIDRIHKTLEATPIVVGSQKRCVEVSAGLTPYHTGEETAAFIERADKALYDAKRQRRHGVVVME